MRIEFFQCNCYSDEHVLKFSLDTEPEDPTLYTSIFLNKNRNFFKRLGIAFKYVFGYKCKYGHFDCFEMRKDDIDRFLNLIEEYKKGVIEFKKKE